MFITHGRRGPQQLAGRVMGIAGVGGGAAVLLGWLTGTDWLKSGLPGVVTMKPNTAVGLMLLGASLWLQLSHPASRRAVAAARVLACAAAVIGSLTLLEYVAGLDLHFDQLLFRETTSARLTAYPGRPAPVTAVCLVALATGLLVRLLPGRVAQLEAPIALFVVIAGLVGMLGYLYESPTLYSLSAHTAMAVHTALLFMLLGVGSLITSPRGHVAGLLAVGGLGGNTFRRLVAASLLVPVLASVVLRWGVRLGWYTNEFETALLLTVTITLFSVLSWRTARHLHRVDQERQELMVGLENRARELADSAARIQATFDRAPIGMIMASFEGRLERVNQAMADLLGYSPEQLATMGVADITHPDDVAKDRTAIEDLAEGRATVHSVTKRYLHSDGHLIWAHRRLSAVRPPGQPPYLIAQVEDITALHESELALAARNAELERSNRELQQFAFVASHDLQEPLRMVASYVELLAHRYRGRLDGDADEYIGYAVEGATRMKSLITDLLEFSKAMPDGIGVKPISVRRCVEAAVEAEADALVQTGGRVQCGALPEVEADPAQITRLFQHLIDNGLKFHNDEAPVINISAEAEADNWLFSVQDNGIGLAPEQSDRIFLMFQRLHSRNQYPGTGIGLTLCRKIVERHGGTIWLEPTGGPGSAFRFTLPRAVEKPGPG